ncbi:hypothetical protein CK203_018394 [Vitis vinifera]|uniref:Uncharacterized protein n=1 Tax=Vitis vinifera TaxID=29760 RepID=A0A438J679_VITVI|nr:hypothetical protein CK203_018394 [Vitis vinifera]
MANKTIGGCVRTPCPDVFAGITTESRTFVVEIACPSIWQLRGTPGREVSTLAPSVGNFYLIQSLAKMATPSRSHSSGRERKMILNGVKPSKETVGKRTTTESSPPGDRKIERRKRCITHPGFNIRASSTSAFKRPSSKLKASTRTRINISWTTGAIPGACNVRPHEPHAYARAPREESSDSTHFSAKRQRDKNPVVKFMRARLGPQEPGRSRPPMATTWAPRPDPMATPMVQNVHPHRDPMSPP